jgi:hypothetical protein
VAQATATGDPAQAKVELGFTVCESAESLVRKPDAGESHIRFDERDLEMEIWSDIQTPTTERVGNS